MNSFNSAKHPHGGTGHTIPVQIQGIFLILIYSLLSGFQGVYLSSLFQNLDPIIILVSCFSLTSLFFLSFEAARFSSFISRFRGALKEILLVNLSTAGAWFGYFYGLKFFEPAIVCAISMSIVPILMVAFAHYLRPGVKANRIELLTSLGLFFSIIFLVIISYSGHSAIGGLSKRRFALGTIMSVAGGISAFLHTMFSKRLNDKGWSAQKVMSVRFFLLLILGISLFPAESLSIFSQPITWLRILLITFIGVILPTYSLQLGIQKSDPFVVSMLLATLPLFYVLAQVFDRRLIFSPYSIVGILFVISLSILGVFSRHRRVVA